jgi:hypothetical protein
MDKVRIEKEARKLQFEIYSQRRMLWPNTEPPVLAMFEPRVIAEYLGFEYDIRDRLGAIDSRTSEAAGTIDLGRQIIAVSAQFSSEERRFTGAHEIAHAVMHPWIGERVAHRDRPMFDLGGEHRAIEEREADYFAACLLAPTKIVIKQFELRFDTRKPFPMTEATLFAIGASNDLFAAPRGSLLFGRAVAVRQSYGTKKFPSLCQHFGLTPSAMAIRLRECGLIVD